ncbi:hypothetical protein B296_00021435 [Ensete ventricosum]|uniref:Uncharacterized protein n=1 Tax=Ensete ventricosum TaxID=4639 RepID=A0A427AWI8_ENSVE|nr:hypothetical protein B296_00021435 [Ensete ventricosum]
MNRTTPRREDSWREEGIEREDGGFPFRLELLFPVASVLSLALTAFPSSMGAATGVDRGRRMSRIGFRSEEGKMAPHGTCALG